VRSNESWLSSAQQPSRIDADVALDFVFPQALELSLKVGGMQIPSRIDADIALDLVLPQASELALKVCQLQIRGTRSLA